MIGNGSFDKIEASKVREGGHGRLAYTSGIGGVSSLSWVGACIESIAILSWITIYHE